MVMTNVLFGDQPDTEETLRAASEFACEIGDIFFLPLTTALPGTRYHVEALAAGRIEKTDLSRYDFMHPIMPSRRHTREEIKALQDKYLRRTGRGAGPGRDRKARRLHPGLRGDGCPGVSRAPARPGLRIQLGVLRGRLGGGLLRLRVRAGDGAPGGGTPPRGLGRPARRHGRGLRPACVPRGGDLEGCRRRGDRRRDGALDAYPLPVGAVCHSSLWGGEPPLPGGGPDRGGSGTPASRWSPT
jgi:hypothetical protein